MQFWCRLFTTTPKLPGIEHFTAAQASGLGSGFGLEDPDTPTDRIHPSESFAAWVSLHTGYEPEVDSQQPQQVDSAIADFVKSETLDDHLPRAGNALAKLLVFSDFSFCFSNSVFTFTQMKLVKDSNRNLLPIGFTFAVRQDSNNQVAFV